MPPGHELASRAYAVGVQVYRWNGSDWDFVEPVARLSADAGFRGRVGTHYAGPTWEGNGGGSVRAERVPDTGCSPDPAAIPWLLLRAVSAEGTGIFGNVAYIQRVHTVGGLRPAAVGSRVEVPYTAEHYFYREKH